MLHWEVEGADSLSIDHGVGAVTGRGQRVGESAGHDHLHADGHQRGRLVRDLANGGDSNRQPPGCGLHVQLPILRRSERRQRPGSVPLHEYVHGRRYANHFTRPHVGRSERDRERHDRDERLHGSRRLHGDVERDRRQRATRTWNARRLRSPNTAPGQPTVTASCGARTGRQVECTFTATATDDWTASGDLTYSWGGGGTGSSITRTYTSPGRKTASVTATDAQGRTSSRGSASVTVDNDPPGQPTVTASCTETACTFTATAIDDWTPSANLTYSWDGGESGQSITRSYTTPGTKRASVTATDAQGRTSPSGSGSGYIPVPNEAPGQPTVTGSCDPMTGTANAGTAQQRCTFTATATDDSTPSANLTYRWNGGEVGRSITRTYTTPGRKTASVTATDPEGLTSPTGSGSVTVPNAAPDQPTIEASCDSMTGTANAGNAQVECTFTAESDDDWTRSENLTYSWSGGGTGMSITRTYRTPGEKTASATATDEQGRTSSRGSGSDTVPNEPPGQPAVTGRCNPMTGTANGGDAQVRCTFSASATDDWTHSGVLTYTWDGGETGLFVTRTYTSPGTKAASATATDPQGADVAQRVGVCDSRQRGPEAADGPGQLRPVDGHGGGVHLHGHGDGRLDRERKSDVLVGSRRNRSWHRADLHHARESSRRVRRRQTSRGSRRPADRDLLPSLPAPTRPRRSRWSQAAAVR